ncbi:hypothetical protein [Actinomadura rubrisoli]|uniref:Uncharacterized protein n=1 Tax=Actinomadura rubrisoli TaxID=2530368 RepID=A0A4R5CJV0_9ACTN|nr:hypothetical protein [Actinomadura rubrisoli]TDD97702.1 hypothetical protein E1298_01310 [Actinomadura rubrisoli]
MTFLEDADEAAWTRLGRLLAARRAELSPKFRSRRLFAEFAGINHRVLYDIESARRRNFSPNTLTAIEHACSWKPGSIARILEGGDPVENTVILGPVRAIDDDPVSPVEIPAEVDLFAIPRWERHLWLAPDLSRKERRLLINLIRAERLSAEQDDPPTGSG